MTSIPDYYQVKFKLKAPADTMIYGILSRFDEEAVRRYDEHKLLTISEAITGNIYLVQEEEVVSLPISGREYDNYVQQEFEAAQKLSDALPHGLFVGKLFNLPRGDGFAWYVVTKVNKKTVVIDWRGFSLDRWYDPLLGMGGKFDRELIEPYVIRHDKIRELFAKIPC